MEKIILENIFKYENNCLYKKNKQTKKWKNCNELKPHINKGYISVFVNKKLYRLHRLVYKYFNEDWDITDSSLDNSIDHKDRNKSNNKIENLQLVNHSQNHQNVDCKGYYKQDNKYQVMLKHNKVRVFKYFYIETDAIRFIELYRKKHYYQGDRVMGLNNQEELELQNLSELGKARINKYYYFSNKYERWICQLKGFSNKSFKTEQECIDYRDKCLNK